jgi:transcriptional regulator with XRE-family HTH domain
MNLSAAFEMRAKMLGVLLRDARLTRGKTARDCAEAIGCAPSVYNKYETGERSPSLPELELLAYFFAVPVNHFWGDQVLSQTQPKDVHEFPANSMTALRDRIIGAQLRQTRLAARIRLKDLAAELGISTGRLSAYEFGQVPIPLPDLEVLAGRLGLPVEHFLEGQGPVGEADSTRRAFERFKQLPTELREFVSQPINESYLRIAQQLSQMPADQLRGIAASLLDITY